WSWPVSVRWEPHARDVQLRVQPTGVQFAGSAGWRLIVGRGVLRRPSAGWPRSPGGRGRLGGWAPPRRCTVVRRTGVTAAARAAWGWVGRRIRRRLHGLSRRRPSVDYPRWVAPMWSGAVGAGMSRSWMRGATGQVIATRRHTHRRGLAPGLCRRPGLAALLGQLARCLDRRLVRRGAAAEVVERGDPWPLLHLAEDPLEVLALQGLALQQLHDQLVENVAVGVEDLPGLGVRGLDERPDLLVDLVRDFQGVVGLPARGAAEERIALLLAVLHGTQPRAHAVLGDHRAGDLGGLIDVRGRPGGRLVEYQLFGRAPTQGEHQPGDHLRAGHHLLVVLGHH